MILIRWTRHIAFLLMLAVVLSAVCALATPGNDPPNPNPKQREGQSNQRTAGDTSPAPNKPDSQALNTKDPVRDENVAIQREIANFTKWLVISGAIIGGLQVFLLLFTNLVSNKAANAARDTADTAATSMVTTQRAFVLMKDARIGPVGEAHPQNIGQRRISGLWVRLLFVNSGDTPALAVAMRTDKIKIDYQKPDSVVSLGPLSDVVRGDISSQIVGPDTEVGAQQILIDNHEIDEILRREKLIFVHVYVEYRDFFPNTPVHRTRACVQIILGDDPRVNPSAALGYLNGPGENNYAD